MINRPDLHMEADTEYLEKDEAGSNKRAQTVLFLGIEENRNCGVRPRDPKVYHLLVNNFFPIIIKLRYFKRF